MLSIFKAIAVSIFFVVIGAGISELNMQTLTIAESYFFSDLDSQTTGVIVKSDHVWIRNNSDGGVRVEYLYMVDDKELLGTVVNYEGVLENVFEILEKYPVGKKVEVFYDSSDIRFAVLEKESISGELLFQIILIFFGIPIIVFVYFFFSGEFER